MRASLTFLESHATTIFRLASVGHLRHAEAKELLLSVAAATFFEIEIKSGLAVRLQQERDLESLIEQRMPHAQGGTLAFPTRKYAIGPVSLYLHASTYQQGFVGMPVPQFLAYYQVIEHFFPVYSRVEARRRFKIALKDPSLDPDDDVAVGRLVALAAEEGRSLGEREQLRLTVASCCDEASLSDFISSDAERARCLASAKHISGTRAVSAKDKNSSVCEQVSQRIVIGMTGRRKARCSLAVLRCHGHTRSGVFFR